MIDRSTGVLIVGAGIGGLCLALTLHERGFRNVRIAERAPRVGALGVGLNVLPNAVRELDSLGLLERLTACAVQTRELSLFNRFGTHIWSEPRGCWAGHQWPQLSIQRKHLQMVLLEAVIERLGEASLLPGFHALSVEQPTRAEAIVRAADGSHLTAGLVVGADGVHSAIRRFVCQSDAGARGTGMVMWRGTTWAAPFLSHATMAVLGDDRDRMVFYPIAPSAACPTESGRQQGHVLVNWVACRPAFDDSLLAADWSLESTAALAGSYFAGWVVPWLDIPELIRRSNQVYLYPLVDRDPLTAWTRGRVTLLGDAAHAMHPNGSNGATQAIVDARALARALADAADVPEALSRYELERLPAMTKLQRSNRQRGPEIVISLAHERAPRGFAHVSDVFSQSELASFSSDYARTGGFDVESVNSGSSRSVTS